MAKVRNREGRGLLWASLTVVLIVGGFGWAVLRSDPLDVEVEGRRLSAWLLDLQIETGERQEKAKRAVKLAGTNAIPFLVSELMVSYSPPRKKFVAWACRQRWLFSVRGTVNGWRDPTEEGRHARGKMGFQVLEFDAAPAFPLLVEALDQEDAAANAAEVLVSYNNEGRLFFGPQIGGALLRTATNENAVVRRHAVYGIGRAQTNLAAAVSTLVAAFNDPDEAVRRTAVMAVGGVYKEHWAVIVPAMVKALDDPSPEVRRRAVTMLGFYGKLAEAAGANVSAATNDPSAEVREAAMKAVGRIRENDGNFHKR